MEVTSYMTLKEPSSDASLVRLEHLGSLSGVYW